MPFPTPKSHAVNEIYPKPVFQVSFCKMRRREGFGVILGCKIYVKEIVPGSIAERDGRIKEGDMVHKINNTAVSDLSLKETRKLLEAGKDRVDMVVRRDWYSALVGNDAAAAAAANNAADTCGGGGKVTVNPNLYVTLPRKEKGGGQHSPYVSKDEALKFLTPPKSNDEFGEDPYPAFYNAATLPLSEATAAENGRKNTANTATAATNTATATTAHTTMDHITTITPTTIKPIIKQTRRRSIKKWSF